MQSIFIKGAEYLRQLRTKFWNIPFIHKAEAQRIFDTVALHLFTQGKPAVTLNGSCKYLTPAGLKCAVGCLIPAELYHPNFEGAGARECASRLESMGYGKLSRHEGLLSDLQLVHDVGGLMDDGSKDREIVWSSTYYMQRALRRVAGKYALSMNYAGSLSFKDR
jgi:hypothetical protein